MTKQQATRIANTDPDHGQLIHWTNGGYSAVAQGQRYDSVEAYEDEMRERALYLAL